MSEKPPANDYRRQGQEAFLKGVSLSFKQYTKYREGWDHDHCEFCGITISEYPQDLNEGYATKDNYHWICKKCYEDFCSEFNWSIE